MNIVEFKHPPFPKLEAFIHQNDLLIKATGSVAAKLPRIVGKGSTKASGLDLPPAPIERKMELVNFEFPKDMSIPNAVIQEIHEVKEELDRELSLLKSEAGGRRLCSRVLERIGINPRGIKNNYFYVGSFILIPDKKRLSYSWGITPHYQIISKIPPDEDYLVKAYGAAEKKVREITMDPRDFESRLRLAWNIARHYSRTNDVLIVDVARMFIIAAQDNRFWQNPQKKNFRDLPEATFILNFLTWKQKRRSDEETKFELVPAVLAQTLRPDAQVFYLPLDAEGTQTRPYKYMRVQEPQNRDS